MEITLVLALVSFCALLYLRWKKSEIDRFLDGFVTPSAIPFIGNIWMLWSSEDRLPNLMRLQQKCGNRFPVKGGFLKVFALFHPDDAGKLLTCKNVNKSWVYDIMFKHWLGSSLFLARGKQHVAKRKLMQPLMVFKNVDESEISFNEASKTLVGILKADASEGKETQVRWLFPLHTMDVMYKYFANVNTGFLNRLDTSNAQAFHEVTKCSYDRVYSPWLWPEFLWEISPTGRKEKENRKELRGFLEKIMQNRKKELFPVDPNENSQLADETFPAGGSKKREKLIPLNSVMVDQYLGRFGITDDYIKDEFTAAIFASHDTTSAALIFCLYLLASHPKEQAKLHLELDEVFGEDKDRNVDFSDLTNLNFLECCIKEVLRLYPPVPLFLLNLAKDFELDKHTKISQGMDILLSPWVTHRLPEFWPEPEEFRPSRFFPENSVGRHPYSFITFAAGPHNCAGQKLAFAMIKTVLAHIFRNFTVELASSAKPLVPLGDMVMFPKDGLKVRFKVR